MPTIRRLPPHLLLFIALAIVASPAYAAGARRSPVSKVPPVYPELARRMHVSGTVVMHLTVQPDGSVSDAKVESGHALLATAALQAARQWRFEPAPDTTDQTVDINFSEGH